MGTKEPTFEGAKRVFDLTTHFKNTTPAQYNRAHFRDLLTAGLEEGFTTAADLDRFDITNGDRSAVFRGEAIEISDPTRELIVNELRQRTRDFMAPSGAK